MQVLSVYTDTADKEKPCQPENIGGIVTNDDATSSEIRASESQQAVKKRAASYNADGPNEVQKDSPALTIDFRKRASTDVDLRSVDKKTQS